MQVDIVAKDARGRDVMLVLVRATKLSEELVVAYIDWIRSVTPPVRFGMLVDQDLIRIVDFEQNHELPIVCTLKTAEMVRTYSPEYGSKRIFAYYLTTLIDAWIRDIVYRWRIAGTPPGQDQLEAIGLLPLLEDGDTSREVLVETDTLS